jgi:son of sevenless-like protein
MPGNHAFLFLVSMELLTILERRILTRHTKGLYLTDLTFLDEGNPDLLEDGGSINLEKYVKTHQLVQTFKSFQFPFPFQPVEEIQDYLKSTINADGEYIQDEFYEMSLAVEPRADSSSKSNDKLDKTVDMLQRTGLV